MYTITDHPKLDEPVMVSALAGWVDAATVGTTAAAHLGVDGRQIASFDPDELFDYRSQRPILDIVDGAMKQTVWPEVVVRYAVVGGRDLIVLTGQEPDLNWRRFSTSVADIAGQLGIVQLITLGAVPAAVPHTMPPPVLTTASNIDILKGEVHLPEGLLRVPAAAVSIIDQFVAEAGIPTVGFFVQVPHYVSGPYTAGVLALVRRISDHLEIEIPIDDLEAETASQREQLDDVVAAQPEAQDYVTRLETLATDQTNVSGEDLASEIERYLRDARRGKPDDPSGPIE